MDNKRKQHRFIWIAGMAASACLLAACGTSQKGQITVEPSGLLLLPDVSERAEVNASFRIPANYFSKRSRLVITPQLLSADSSVLQEYAPVVLDASVYRKKVERLEVLDGFSDPYAAVAKEVDHTRAFRVPYRAEIQFPEGLKSGSLRAVVSNDGCGECSGVDTLLLASIRNPLSLLRKETKLVALESDFVVRPKVREGKGVANLQFVINRFDINPEMGNNREEMEGMVETLAPVLQDSLSILNNLDITGIASADGSLAFNTELSRNRALSAKRWLVERLDIPAAIERKITVSSRPEGWTPVLEAMRRAGDKDADRVEAILEKYADENDDVQEYHIRRLPCWNRIKDNYLQKDRVVEYRYAYTVKSFTSDAEMLALYRRRPDAFNEEELLRVATLTENDDDRAGVYRTTLKYYPRSVVAANNLALYYLQRGETPEALAASASLEGTDNSAAANTRAAALIADGRDADAVRILRQHQSVPEARYNLGLLLAAQGETDEAYRLLLPFADLNAAILALQVGEREKAKEILAGLDDNVPEVRELKQIMNYK